jgi:hypothetical protein
VIGRLAGLCSFLLILASLGSVGVVVMGDDAVRAQVTKLHFPVRALAEGNLIMVVPIVLCALGTLCALPAIRHRIGRLALGAAVLNWGVIFALIGLEGFKSLL